MKKNRLSLLAVSTLMLASFGCTNANTMSESSDTTAEVSAEVEVTEVEVTIATTTEEETSSEAETETTEEETTETETTEEDTTENEETSEDESTEGESSEGETTVIEVTSEVESSEEPTTEEASTEETTEAAAGSIAIDEQHFPNNVFRKYVSLKLDPNNDGVLDEAEILAVKEIRLNNDDNKLWEASDLSGVEYFTALQVLSCPVYEITWLDVSKNTELVELDCSSTKLTELDVTHNPALKSLAIDFTYISDLNLSNNPELEVLTLGGTAVSAIDLSHNPKLKALDISYTPIRAFDFAPLQSLEEITAMGTVMPQIDISKNTALKMIIVSVCDLESLDISNNPNLEEVVVTPTMVVTGAEGRENIITRIDPTKPQFREDGTVEVVKLADGRYTWAPQENGQENWTKNRAKVEDGYLNLYGPCFLSLYDENGNYVSGEFSTRSIAKLPMAKNANLIWFTFVEENADMINQSLSQDPPLLKVYITVKGGVVFELEVTG